MKVITPELAKKLSARMREQVDKQVLAILIGGIIDSTINDAGHIEKPVKGCRVDENESRKLITHE